MMDSFPQRVAGQAFHVMVKPIGPLCNLDCSYCFYLEKASLFAANEKWRMSDEMLEHYVRSYIASQPADVPITFAWQGGEPTLCGVGFFRKAVKWQKQYGKGRQIENALQTNGTLLNEDWARFLHDEGFLVGISIDGPEKLHDAYRVDRGHKGSFRSVMHGVGLLQQFRVEFNTLTCVHKRNVGQPLEVYRFLRGIGSTFLQFIPIVERKANAGAREYGLSRGAPKPGVAEGEEHAQVYPWSVPAEAYGDFLIEIFNRWVTHDVGRIYVQMFDVALGKWLGMEGGLCLFAKECGTALALEHEGGLYSCDHYVYPDFHLGNIGERSLADMLESKQQQDFGRNKSALLPKYCRECPVLFACNGGCPKQRFLKTPDGEPGLNYLCAGYRKFFTVIDPAMRRMAALYRQGRAPAEVMR